MTDGNDQTDETGGDDRDDRDGPAYDDHEHADDSHGAHEPHVRRALDLARATAANGNTPFGSLLVQGGEVIAESENTTRTDDDITAHPELKLVRWAARELNEDERDDVTIYTSTEPCPMCAGAIALSGLGPIVYSVSGETAAEYSPSEKPTLTVDLLERVDEVEIVGPGLEREGRAAHRKCWNDEGG